MTSDSKLEEFLSEGVIMKNFHHPNVLGLLGVVFDTPDGVPYLILPFMKNGNLKDYRKSRRVVASDFNTLPQVGLTSFSNSHISSIPMSVCRTYNCLTLPRCVLMLCKGWST